jgi:hypothetical protein
MTAACRVISNSFFYIDHSVKYLTSGWWVFWQFSLEQDRRYGCHYSKKKVENRIFDLFSTRFAALFH